jgi:hypothetical protein
MSYFLSKNKALFLDRLVVRSHNANMIGQFFLVVIFVLFSAAQAFADVVSTTRRDEEAKRVLADQAPSRKVGAINAFLFESGGMLSYRYYHYDNIDKDDTQEDDYTGSRWTDMRLWGRLSYQTPEMKQDKRWYLFYTRFRAAYVEQTGEAPGARYDLVGPSVEYAYASFDWKPWKLEAGRRYFSIGRGIAYSGIDDGLQLNYQCPGWDLGLFFSKTLPHERNIDTSVPGYDKESRRYFGGISAAYTGIKDVQLYSYFMGQKDRSQEKPEDVSQDYNYDSRYAGLGVKGGSGKHWKYWTEVISETGISREYGTNAKSNIHAWAADSELKYLTGWPSGTTVTGQYSYGSGDPDRVSVTDTVNGNTEGKDRNFLHFGYYRSSLALAPYLSNLRVARLGVEAQPLYRWQLFKKMTWGIDHYRFWKDLASGGISDTDATQHSRDVGYETDLRMNWPIVPRVVWAMEYGIFTPGKAYAPEADTKEKVFSASLTIFF